MGKKTITILISVLMVIGIAFSSFADTGVLINGGLDGSKLLENENESTGFSKGAKGRYISTGMISISNEGKSTIGVTMKTFAHQEVDETSFYVYLDKWIESDQRWSNVADYSFSFSKEDYPNESLASKAISFDITDQPAGYTYRLRGIHVVVVDGNREQISSKTDGIVITK